MIAAAHIASNLTSHLPTPGAAPAAAESAPFSGVFHSMLQQTVQTQTDADQAAMGVMQGRGVELQDAMIATQKADISFELALSVRNKAVAAYQQMMNMQF